MYTSIYRAVFHNNIRVDAKIKRKKNFIYKKYEIAVLVIYVLRIYFFAEVDQVQFNSSLFLLNVIRITLDLFPQKLYM